MHRETVQVLLVKFRSSLLRRVPFSLLDRGVQEFACDRRTRA